MTNLRFRYSSNDVHDAFLAAVEAYYHWRDGEDEPTIEVHEQHIPISRVCGLAWNCTDTIPSLEFYLLRDMGLPIRRGTYAACARALKTEIQGAQ